MIQEIELAFSFGEYGWSDFRIWTKEEHIEIGMTHIFSNPLEEMFSAFTELLKGIKSTYIMWFDEPGAYRWEITRDEEQHHILDISITETASMGEWKESDRVISEIEFTVKQQQLMACIYGEAIKLRELMKIKTYKINRNEQYPARALNEFLQAYEASYS
ncbi:hypothetical protein ACJJIU_10045 [Microbulbifer sp. CnH-101-E]|uniref:hypothetical protein n=1 Tax=unclassified Microbulbifer TaxID=2619833 RepID=UPI0040397AE8